MTAEKIILAAFERYIKAEYPEEGESGMAFIESVPLEHFTAGWEAALGMKRGHTMTTTSAAKVCGVSSSTLLRAVKARKIKASKTPGGHYRVTLADVRAFMGGKR